MKRVLLLLLLLIVAAGGGAWWVWMRVSTSYRAFAQEEQFVDVPAGTGIVTIATRLAEAGVVPDPLTFRIAARLSGTERRLQAGEYRFTNPASPLEVAERLARGDVFTRAVTFPEGLTIWEMAETFARGGLGTANEFERAAANATLVNALDPGADSLEGYLFPDTYALPRRAGADAVVAAMVGRFERAFDEPLRAAARAAGLSLRDVVTIASLVEKETAAPEERPIVAAVYRNRLRIGMLLQCDPTVIYALRRRGEWRGNLTRAHLQMDSPYNTYRYAGLPPGPIASPGRASLDATLHPADVRYLYFVSRNDGTHAFATTLAEHNRNVAEWQVRYFRRPR